MAAAGYVDGSQLRRHDQYGYGLLLVVTIVCFLITCASICLMGWFLVANRDYLYVQISIFNEDTEKSVNYTYYHVYDFSQDEEDVDNIDSGFVTLPAAPPLQDFTTGIPESEVNEITVVPTLRPTVPPGGRVPEPDDKVPDPGDVNQVGPEPVTDAELGFLSQILWNADVNRLPHSSFHLDLQINVSESNRADRTPRRLFQYVPSMGDKPTYDGFVSLLNNYHAPLRLDDALSEADEREVTSFLLDISATKVMEELRNFFLQNGYIHDERHFVTLLRGLWFTPYNRSPKYPTTDSSAFEHVFVGETRGSRVIGLHSWLQFYEEERKGDLDYRGYVYSIEPRLLAVQYKWLGKKKAQSSFFVGTSPEFDIAIYTLCIMTRANHPCHLQINGYPFRVITEDIDYLPGLQIGLAYPAPP